MSMKNIIKKSIVMALIATVVCVVLNWTLYRVSVTTYAIGALRFMGVIFVMELLSNLGNLGKESK